MKARTAVKNVLLAFVLITIGYAIGREATLRSMGGAASTATTRSTSPTSAPADQVIVNYLHATIRCVTCNRIEKMAHDLVTRDFADALRTGRVQWRTTNFQEADDLARRYDVSSATVVVSRQRGGREVGFERLDDVWKLNAEPEQFESYVGAAIRAAMKETAP